MRRIIQRVVPRFAVLILAAVLTLMMTVSHVMAATIFESGTLGPTGVTNGDGVPAANVSASVFNGVRFQLTQPVMTSQVGGHFFANPFNGNSFFGAVVRLENENDFPNSGNLTTPDVLGHTLLTFPSPSAEVFGDLKLSLVPGWYALVFGSGLFGSHGDGAMPLNNPDIGSPTYIGFQPGPGWFNLSILSDVFQFKNYRFVVTGEAIPEPSTIILAACLVLAVPCLRQRRRVYPWSADM